MANKYLNRLNWAVFTMIDRTTQDDKKSKITVSGLFSYPENAEDFIKALPADHKWYILDFDRWNVLRSSTTSFRTSMKSMENTQYFILMTAVS